MALVQQLIELKNDPVKAFRHPVKNHVILIDDARLFNGTNGYPTLGEVKEAAETTRPDFSFYVEQDIIRIHKK